MHISVQPLAAERIYHEIVERGLYRFLARDPLHVVDSQLRRHCDNLKFPSPRRKKYFTRVDGGRYALLERPVEVEPTAYKVKSRKGAKEVIAVFHLRAAANFIRRAVPRRLTWRYPRRC